MNEKLILKATNTICTSIIYFPLFFKKYLQIYRKSSYIESVNKRETLCKYFFSKRNKSKGKIKKSVRVKQKSTVSQIAIYEKKKQKYVYRDGYFMI